MPSHDKKFEHGGDVRQLARAAGISQREMLDFSANINPLGPPEWLPSLISSQLGELRHYPDPHCTALVEAVAERYGVSRGSHCRQRVDGDSLSADSGGGEVERPDSSSFLWDYGKAAAQARMRIQTIPADQELPGELLTADTAVFLVGRTTQPERSFPADWLRALAVKDPSALFSG